MMGNSYGGNTTLFHGALDERIHFACASGAAGVMRIGWPTKWASRLAEVIRGFVTRFDIPDLLTCREPRRVLIVSATNDPFSQDAERRVAAAQAKCVSLGGAACIAHRCSPRTLR